MAQWFHVTSSNNRDSIKRHGLDWAHMKAARGIAGSTAPEQDGIFVCFSEVEAGFFIDMNNTGGPVDLWAVQGIDLPELVEVAEGFLFLPRPIPPSQLTLVRTDIEPPDEPDEESLDGTGGWSGYAASPEHWTK